MDRFVVKEPRAGAGFPQGIPMMQFTETKSGNSMSENIYYVNYPSNIQSQNLPHNMNQIRPQLNAPQIQALQMNSPHMGQQTYTMIPQNMAGIDPRYLSGYGDASPQYILADQMQRNQPHISSFGDYQNKSFEGAERIKPKQLKMNVPQVMTLGGLEPSKVEEMPKAQSKYEPKPNQIQRKEEPSFQNNFGPLKKPTELDLIRNDVKQQMSRADKLKALHKSGPRAFSGPVEKVLKWHKTLQDIGILIIYEVVAKCVNVRPGEHSAKNLVIRDDSGPAMQVVYYEIDFMLPELKPPCMVRVIGRMMAGTCRLQAFSVRPAAGDDVATLPRRAAAAAHHIGKLCKEYGNVKNNP